MSLDTAQNLTLEYCKFLPHLPREPQCTALQANGRHDDAGLTINRTGHTGPHLTAPDHLEHHTGPFGAFSELLMIRVLQLTPY